MKDLFETGVGFRTFLLNQSHENRNKFTKYYITISIKQECRDRIAAVNRPVNILGIMDGLCTDCIMNLSVLEKLISTNSNIQLRLLSRNDVDHRLADYKEYESLKVPTFMFMDKNFEIKASFIEKPLILKNAKEDTIEGSKLQASYIAGSLADETAAEMLELIERAAY